MRTPTSALWLQLYGKVHVEKQALYRGFPGGSEVKNPHATRETWVGKIFWRRAWQLTPVFLPGESPWTRGAWLATVYGITKSQTD